MARRQAGLQLHPRENAWPPCLDDTLHALRLESEGMLTMAAHSTNYLWATTFHRLSTDTSIDLRETIRSGPQLEGSLTPRLRVKFLRT